MGYMGAGPNWIPKLLDGLGLDLKIDYIRSMVTPSPQFWLGNPWYPTSIRRRRVWAGLGTNGWSNSAMARPGGWKLHRGQGCPEQRWHSRGRCSDMYGLQWKKSDDDLTLGNPCKILLHGNCAEMLKAWVKTFERRCEIFRAAIAHGFWSVPACGPSVGDVAFQRGQRYAAGLWGNPRRIGLSSSEAYYGPFHFVIAIAFQFWCKVRFFEPCWRSRFQR